MLAIVLLAYMSVSSPWFDRRIKGLLPRDTEVMHKTGTAGTIDGQTRATNDVGIITLPNGNHLAISVFISDSYASRKERELTIAKISRAAFDYWSKADKNYPRLSTIIKHIITFTFKIRFTGATLFITNRLTRYSKITVQLILSPTFSPFNHQILQ